MINEKDNKKSALAKPRRNWFARNILLVVIISLFGIPAGLNYSGFCISQGRWLSDEELIKLQIADVNRRADVQDSQHLPNVPRIPYNSAEELMEKNPDCCKLGARSGPDGIFPRLSFLDRILGADREVVWLQYKDYYHDKDGVLKFSIATWNAPITNCGKNSWH